MCLVCARLAGRSNRSGHKSVGCSPGRIGVTATPRADSNSTGRRRRHSRAGRASAHMGSRAWHLEALRALGLAQGRPETSTLVIRDPWASRSPHAFSARFDRLVAAAELPHLTEIHHLCHSLARTLHEDGIAPIVGASLLGHSLATHLQNYLPTGDEYVQATRSASGDSSPTRSNSCWSTARLRPTGAKPSRCRQVTSS